jgi:hypothetical protein
MLDLSSKIDVERVYIASTVDVKASARYRSYDLPCSSRLRENSQQ